MKRIALVAVCLQFSACAMLRSVGPSASAPKASADNDEMVIAAALQQVQANAPSYRISGADLVQITVFGEEELGRMVRVGQKGGISMPLVGQIMIGGLTVPEAEKKIAGSLAEFVRNPQVTLFIKEYGNKKVFVFGQVSKPGAIELPTESPMTVLEAISQAGGFTKIAAPDRTRVVRLVDGVSKSFTVEVSAVTKRGMKEKDLPLEPNDIVFVPESIF